MRSLVFRAGALLVAGLILSEALLMAQPPAGPQQAVPLPQLPRGAGVVDADAPQTFTKSASGLEYRVLRKGAGPAPSPTSTVTVHYHGWLDSGKTFDSSYDRGEKISFPLNGVIRGWTEGLQYVGKGGMIELSIPSNLGYGSRGAPPVIPPDARLHFLVELHEIR